jgi:tRNA(adenine34) deaminase
MEHALKEAMAAAARGEVPVGAVLTNSRGQVLAASGNRTEELQDPTAHAEMLVIRHAAESLRTRRLLGCSLYVTLEPCAMCAQAISLSRIKRLYFGAADEKGGAVEHGVRLYSDPSCHHKPEIYGGLNASRAKSVLREFFLLRR